MSSEKPPASSSAKKGQSASSGGGTKVNASKESSLAQLFTHFVGLDLIVETKQGRSYRGRLREADQYMNIVLSGSDGDNESQHQSPPPSGPPGADRHDFASLHIRGPSIRYIVFGAGVDLAACVRAGRDRERAAGDRYKRGVRKAPRK